MIRSTEYIELMTKTENGGEKILRIFMPSDSINTDAKYLKFFRDAGVEIIADDLRVNELMVAETDHRIILLHERESLCVAPSHPVVDKYKAAS